MDPRVEVRDWNIDRSVPPSKALASVDFIIKAAMANPGKMVTYSKGHTQGSARGKAKRIRRGHPRDWEPYLENIQTGTTREKDGTYSVVICWRTG